VACMFAQGDYIVALSLDEEDKALDESGHRRLRVGFALP